MMLPFFFIFWFKNCFAAILAVAVSASFLQSSNIQALGISPLSREKKNPDKILDASQGFSFANLC